jgi:hypothetical protein
MSDLEIMIIRNMFIQILEQIIRFIFRQFINAFRETTVNPSNKRQYARLTNNPFQPVTGLVRMTG